MIPSSDVQGFDRLVFTSDLLKLDDRSADIQRNPQRINIDWIHALFSQSFAEHLGVDRVGVEYGDERGYGSARWQVYSKLGLPLETASWARIFDGDADLMEVIEPVVLDRVQGGLVVGFELPPYMLKVLARNSIPYVDFAIHPIRYLPDYMFGVRTNVGPWRERIRACALPESVMRDFARISRSRTVRVMRDRLPDEGSVLFLGQIEVDASLIAEGKMAGTEDVERALTELSFLYSKIYYKHHPHHRDPKSLKRMVQDFRRCEWLEVNVYDAFGCGRFDLIATLSSGAAIEAKYFGLKSRWMLARPNYFDAAHPNEDERYYPIYGEPFRGDFWRHVFSMQDGADAYPLRLPDPAEGATRFGLNMKWGR